ncbi:hypothetical protein [Clostridium butyricum]|uniref:hypothetical protein n=1 Tax=Clostridium butyricum TaxID=1492 RepID=UPI00210451F8|nr:hypothetical protein [Clostridium butyricum]MCQ2026633.1 hypothetical protein [Clostridium butyricum]
MQEIIKPFRESLFDKNLTDIGIDMLEVGIDNLLQEGLAKNIPIVGSIVKVGQFVYNIYDRNLLKQTLVFIRHFNNNTIDSEKVKKYKESLERDSSKAEKELGRVLIILNKTIDLEKTNILAKLYLAYVDEKIMWKDFCEFSEIIDRLFVNDIDILFDIHTKNKGGIYVERNADYIYQRLISIGLLKNNIGIGALTHSHLQGISEKPTHIELTQLGHIFCRIVT